ncbi:hypothetical protein FO519_005722 [Halicephalobus sp. NKZ332]|nr:hypothetical protein FO519_005722 [Halicephalobus sp. NKZ332]
MKLPIFFSLFWILIEAQPKSGPCILGTHPTSQKLKCTDKGYFELTQCAEKYCACVDPRTGHEADGTKTFSNRILPRCGLCFTNLAKQLASDDTDYFPACEGDYGNYQPKQCRGIRCTCVNPESGAVIRRGGPELNCEPEDQGHSSDFYSIPADKNHEQVPLANAKCGLKKDAGQRCSNAASKVMWYYDTTVFQCLAFKFQGCGGNGNRFNSINECWSSCILQDFGGCAMMKPPLKDPNGESVVCRTRRDTESRECPQGYKCTHLPFFSLCCEKSNEELFQKNASPKCGPSDKTPVTLSAGGMTINLLGRSCSDDFCPENSECKGQELLAHCCSK